MRYKVLWSELATETYLSILEEVQLFSQKDAERLEEKVIAFTDRLAEYRHLCPPAPNLPRYRKCVVTKYFSFVYEAIENEVFITAFLDNRADNLY